MRWQAQVKDVARTMRATILGHRDIVRLSIGRILAELADHVAADDADHRFELLLDLFVDGLAQRAHP